MDRRAFLLTAGVLTSPVSLGAQQAARPRVVELNPLPATAVPSRRALHDRLREFGYTQGQNILVEYRFAGGSEDRLREYASQAVRENVSVILAVSSSAVRAATKATSTLPKGPESSTHGDSVADARDAQEQLLVELAGKYRLPTTSIFSHTTEAGLLMSYGPNLDHLFRQAAAYVDRILKGATPGDLPIERPAKFELALNLQAARALGLKLPASLLQRADRVIE